VRRKKKKSRWKIAMLSRKSRTSVENEVVGRKIKTAAGLSDLSLQIEKFSCRTETSRTSRRVPGLRRISSDSFEFPADDPDFQRQARNAAHNSQQAAENRDFSRTFDGRPPEEKILSPSDISSDSFVLAAAKSRISPNNF
jgi:hypothetical protein